MATVMNSIVTYNESGTKLVNSVTKRRKVWIQFAFAGVQLGASRSGRYGHFSVASVLKPMYLFEADAGENPKKLNAEWARV
jgi:hypothetical protein